MTHLAFLPLSLVLAFVIVVSIRLPRHAWMLWAGTAIGVALGVGVVWVAV